MGLQGRGVDRQALSYAIHAAPTSGYRPVDGPRVSLRGKDSPAHGRQSRPCGPETGHAGRRIAGHQSPGRLGFRDYRITGKVDEDPALSMRPGPAAA